MHQRPVLHRWIGYSNAGGVAKEINYILVGTVWRIGGYGGIALLSVPGKVFAYLLLVQIRSHLLKHQRPEQFGFMPGKSTTNWILSLSVLMERRYEFRQ